MKPRVIFPDSERAMIGYLAGADWPVKPSISNSFKAPTGEATHVQVELDGTPLVEYPVTQRATVRFTAWAAPGKPDNAKSAASIAQAFVATHPGDGDVWSTRILTGPLKGIDPTTKCPFVSFTARISLRPKAL